MPVSDSAWPLAKLPELFRLQLLGASLIQVPFDLLTNFSVLIGGALAIGAYIRKCMVVDFHIDTGVEVSVIPEQVYRQLDSPPLIPHNQTQRTKQ